MGRLDNKREGKQAAHLYLLQTLLGEHATEMMPPHLHGTKRTPRGATLASSSLAIRALGGRYHYYSPLQVGVLNHLLNVSLVSGRAELESGGLLQGLHA